MLCLMIEPLVVIMHRDREHLLGVVLADHVVVEDFADFLRRRNTVTRLHQRGLVLLTDDVHAQFNAFIADEYGRAGNELAHFVLALAAERAVEGILGIAAADFAHSILRHTLPTFRGRRSRITAVTQRSKFRAGLPARRPRVLGRPAIPSLPYSISEACYRSDNQDSIN